MRKVKRFNGQPLERDNPKWLGYRKMDLAIKCSPMPCRIRPKPAVQKIGIAYLLGE